MSETHIREQIPPCREFINQLWPYLISFELTEAEVLRTALSAVLLDMGAVPLLNHAWLLTSDWNAGAILEQLRPIVGAGSRLLVVELGEDLAGLNLKGRMPEYPMAMFGKFDAKVN
jgi:hypothetical protein